MYINLHVSITKSYTLHIFLHPSALTAGEEGMLIMGDVI